MRFDQRPKRPNAGSRYVDNPSSFVSPGSGLKPEPLCQRRYQTLYLFELEIMSLKGQAGVVSTAIIHEPDGHRDRCQRLSDISRDHFLASSVEVPMPLGQDRARARHELDARIEPISESLVELMQRHRHEVIERVTFQFSKALLRELVLYEQSVKPTMFRKTPVTQQGSYQYLLLPTCQYGWIETNFPRRYPVHSPIVGQGYDSGTFTDIAGLVIDVAVEEDRYLSCSLPTLSLLSVSAGPDHRLRHWCSS
jgi:hypothetical protein